MKRVTTCLGFRRQLAASAFATVSVSEMIRESKVRMGSTSEHTVGVDGVSGNFLDYVPMLDDCAVLAAENVDRRKTRGARPAHHVHVHDHILAIDETAVNGVPGSRALLAHTGQKALQRLEARFCQGAVLHIARRQVF